MSTRLDYPYTGPALRLHLIEVLAPTCGMETPNIASACWDFIHQDAAVKIDTAMFRGDKAPDKPSPQIPENDGQAALPPTKLRWPVKPPSIDMDAVERLYAAGLPQTAIADRLGIGPEKLKKALAAASDIKARWPRNAAGIPQHTLYPETAPWPPADDWANAVEPGPDRRGRFTQYAQEGLSEEDIAKAENIKKHSVSASMSTYRLTGVWRENQAQRLGVAPGQHRDKKSDRDILEPLCRAGASRNDIAKALGVAPNGIHMRVAKAGLSHVWENAKLAQAPKEETPTPPKVREAKPSVTTEEPITAKRADQVIDKLNKPVLPEDRLRRADDPAPCPCDIETVENWLEGQGLKLTFEGAGIYTCEGTPMTAAQLVKRANKARKGLSLPAFDVRGI
ncbi:MAG: hypothetical protein LDL39_12755 [Magnetospirillum sp.]|nr:hypothetical protein [Magnetospirillum sp.]